MSTPALKQARLVLAPETVGAVELMLADLALVLTTMTPDDGRTWHVDALFDGGVATGQVEDAIGQAAAIAGSPVPAVEWQDLPDRDWVAETQKILQPLRIGRFFIHGPDNGGTVPTAAVAIEIEAGMAFGTGRHATTAGCLLALDRLRKARRFRRILDLGCGSGILAMAAVHLWPARILGSDIDPVAVATATENARKNGLGGRVRFLTSDGLSDRRLAAAAPYDLIVANILALPLVRMSERIAAATAAGGAVVLSGLLVSQESLVLPAFRRQGLRLAGRIRRDNWATLILAK